MNKKIAIVEDDSFISEELSLIVSNLGYQVIGTAKNESEAIPLLKKGPDLVLLDIDLGAGGSGFEVAKFVQNEAPCLIMFVTSFFDDLTVSEARNFSPSGYIVKPFKDSDIKTNLALAFNKGQFQHEQKTPPDAQHLFIKKDGESKKIDPADILFMMGDDNYTHIHFSSGDKILSSSTLKKLTAKLAPFGFVRVHKSYSVKLSEIDIIQGNNLYVKNTALPIGKSYKSELLEQLTII